MHAFVLWDEAGVPHTENPRADFNPGSSCCDVMVLTTALCGPPKKNLQGKWSLHCQLLLGQMKK